MRDIWNDIYTQRRLNNDIKIYYSSLRKFSDDKDLNDKSCLSSKISGDICKTN